MKKTFVAAGIAALVSTSAVAETVGYAMSEFNDNWLTIMRNAAVKWAEENGHTLIVEDGQSDVGRQLDQINNFVASGVDAIVVVPIDGNATQALTDAAASAGIPMVYANRVPGNFATLPDNQVVVASDETESGTVETMAVCQMLRNQGKVDGGARAYILQGQLHHPAGIQRTKDIHDVVAMDMCNFIEIIDTQVGNFYRDQAQDLMTNWLTTGDEFDAVIANNDEMAIGAILSMKAAGIDMDSVIVAGIDATPDALLAMAAGDLDITVFQNAAAQGAGSIETAIALSRGESVPKFVRIPFELVTPENMDAYVGSN
ncbi:MAG: substrate-binding domain-containing protein [Paracoccaceae bacterium]|nr:substrate-binding domain-containing protein [Paracoccaceae bacterium]MDE2914101.1 substrate-binding domain-containing protein [Paracoccaceae bacterium]